jgi:2-polyprenyl-3-methyl-5-hydroxy-6-metoxy-1,4-benzoquinol methylase
MNCKICHRTDTRVQYRLTKSRLDVFRCVSCGFTFSDYAADESHLASDGHGVEGVPDAKPAYLEKFGRHLRQLELLTGPVRGKKILDVGAGGGGWLAIAASAGAQVEGIEFCEDCRKYAAEVRGMILRSEGIEQRYWSERAGEFDLVTCWDVIEHVVDPIHFLSACSSLVRPGGSFVFTTPVRDTWFDRIGVCAYRLSFGRVQFILRQRYSRIHLQIFHSAQLEEILRGEKLQPIYYRKIQELSFPHRQYLRNVGFAPRWAGALGSISERALSVVPITNKVFGIFRKSAARAGAPESRLSEVGSSCAS